MNKTIFKFPKEFYWGAATSSHQVEGDNFNNDWWGWEQKGKTREASGKACDHWNLYEEDFKLARSLHHNAHRFSIEWSRIEPEEGRFDEGAIRQYHKMVQCLKSQHMEPFVTLNHFTLPLWISQKGGWLYKNAPELFGKFVRRLMQSIGSDAKYWLTLNEPLVYMYKSYWEGEWPPGEKSYDKCHAVIRQLLKAHVAAYQAIKDASPAAMVGVAQHVSKFTPCNVESMKDRFSAKIRNFAFNHLFIKTLLAGRIFYPGLLYIRLPLANTLDFIGINYYTRTFVKHIGISLPAIFGDSCEVGHHSETVKKNAMNWEIYPEGLHELLNDFKQYRVPILISENGICTDYDEERSHFIHDHIRAVGRAMKDGCPVMGYLYWSLLDNFEWAEGFHPRFGIIQVDFKSQDRTIRPSALAYSEICRANEIEI